MKKIILFVFLGLLCSGTALAEEMIIQLRSGNTMVIEYSGAIDKVTLNGETDAIVGINMKRSSMDTVQEPRATPEPENQPARSAAGKDSGQEEKWFRLKWAEPKTED